MLCWLATLLLSLVALSFVVYSAEVLLNESLGFRLLLKLVVNLLRVVILVC